MRIVVKVRITPELEPEPKSLVLQRSRTHRPIKRRRAGGGEWRLWNMRRVPGSPGRAYQQQPRCESQATPNPRRSPLCEMIDPNGPFSVENAAYNICFIPAMVVRTLAGCVGELVGPAASPALPANGSRCSETAALCPIAPGRYFVDLANWTTDGRFGSEEAN